MWRVSHVYTGIRGRGAALVGGYAAEDICLEKKEGFVSALQDVGVFVVRGDGWGRRQGRRVLAPSGEVDVAAVREQVDVAAVREQVCVAAVTRKFGVLTIRGQMGLSSGAGLGVAVMGGECDYVEICRDGSHCSEMA